MSKVSVIIPNYNYARYLKSRLDSVALQTKKPDEIIFLDDCSSDNSLEVAKKLLQKYNIPYKIVLNEKNQGVFAQWLKGIALAQYEHIWIAEADDYCELNLLEKLLPAFNDKDVILSYCQAVKVNSEGQYIKKQHQDIAFFIDPSRWSNDYVNNCYQEASQYLTVISCISNASGVVLKKSALPIEKLSQVTQFKMSGDWFFYLITLFENPQSKLAYCAEGLNYWRQHVQSVWGDPKKQLFGMRENFKIYTVMLETYQIPRESKVAIFNMLSKWYFYHLDESFVEPLSRILYLIRKDIDEAQFNELINLILKANQEIARLNQQHLNQLQHIEALTNTLSWRITRPIRFARRLFSFKVL